MSAEASPSQGDLRLPHAVRDCNIGLFARTSALNVRVGSLGGDTRRTAWLLRTQSAVAVQPPTKASINS
jgi:hypothetical protein